MKHIELCLYMHSTIVIDDLTNLHMHIFDISWV